MKVIILDAAHDVVHSCFEGTPEQIVAATPEGGFTNPWVPPVDEAVDEPPPVVMAMLKIAVFNANGYPNNVLDIDESVAVEWIGRLPPTNTAVTLTGTPYENVVMPGDLPSLADLQAELEVTSDDSE